MTLPNAADDAPASEGDGQDSSEPPNGDRKPSVASSSAPGSSHHNGIATSTTAALSHHKGLQSPRLANGHANSTQRESPISASSPDHNSHLRDAGNSHKGLEPLVVPHPSLHVRGPHSTTTSTSPSPTSSPSPSESNPWSAPPTRPPSRPPSQPQSRAASMSGTRPDLSSLASSPAPAPTRAPVEASPALRTKPSSVHSSEGGGHKFNLKDLLGSAPKLSRKSSARSSVSSRKSDSEGGPKSTGGESTGLLKKYGTCERVAIGKGATSVVRLAHKWDRSEEKLYAVKVLLLGLSSTFINFLVIRRSSESDARTRQKRNM